MLSLYDIGPCVDVLMVLGVLTESNNLHVWAKDTAQEEVAAWCWRHTTTNQQLASRRARRWGWCSNYRNPSAML